MKMIEQVFPDTKNSSDETSGYAFFSYSRKDKLRIRDLSVFFKRDELQPWVDNQLKLGEIWQEELKDKIEHCKLFVILVSENSRTSRFVKWEIDRAIQHNKSVLAIKLITEDELLDELKGIRNLEIFNFWEFAKPNWGLAESIRNSLHPNQIPSQQLFRQRLEIICFYLFEVIGNKIPHARVFTGIGSGMMFNVNGTTSLNEMTTDKWLLFFDRLDNIFGREVFIFPAGFKYFQFFPTVEKLIDYMMKNLTWEDIKLIRFKFP